MNFQILTLSKFGRFISTNGHVGMLITTVSLSSNFGRNENVLCFSSLILLYFKRLLLQWLIATIGKGPNRALVAKAAPQRLIMKRGK
jgi:hypothetical protein